MLLSQKKSNVTLNSLDAVCYLSTIQIEITSPITLSFKIFHGVNGPLWGCLIHPLLFSECAPAASRSGVLPSVSSTVQLACGNNCQRHMKSLKINVQRFQITPDINPIMHGGSVRQQVYMSGFFCCCSFLFRCENEVSVVKDRI